jgi:hypothetical protein
VFDISLKAEQRDAIQENAAWKDDLLLRVIDLVQIDLLLIEEMVTESPSMLSRLSLQHQRILL